MLAEWRKRHLPVDVQRVQKLPPGPLGQLCLVPFVDTPRDPSGQVRDTVDVHRVECHEYSSVAG